MRPRDDVFHPLRPPPAPLYPRACPAYIGRTPAGARPVTDAAAVPTSAASPPPTRTRYHTRQLIAHWTIVMLVAMQFLMNAGMQRAFDASEEAGRFVLNGGVITHAMGGSLILMVMLYRLWLRRTHGAPPPPSTLPHWLQVVSRSTHYAFYGVLIAMPLAGWLAILTLWGWVATIHALTAWLLLALIALHAAGAFWHAVKRDGTIARILQPDPAHGSQAGVTPEA